MRITQFSYMASSSPIEAATGLIRGVSVIKKGLAEGHDLWIDDETLSKLLSLCKDKTVKVQINHPEKGKTAQFQSTAGQLENFRIDGEHLRADLSLLRSGEHFDQIVEMSQKMADKFGLSVRIGQDVEKKDGKEYCRPISIESVDLVDDPAANLGLFSKKGYGGDHADADDIEKLEKDGKTHTKDCMCKSCKMSKKSKSMSAIFAKALGLPENATDEEIAAAFAKRAPATQTADLTELQKKIDSATTTLAELQRGNANTLSLSKKAEIDNLMAEAARDGKVVPLDNDDLYTMANGVCTIKTEPVQLSKMISKLQKGQVALSTKKPTVPTNEKGEPIEFDRRTPEGKAKQIAFSKERQAAGADSLGQFIRKQAEISN